MRSEPLPNLKLEGALFVLNLASEATFDGDEAVTTPGRPSQRKGIELTASYKPLPWLRLDGDFAATHARYANGDNGAADTEPGHPGSYIPGAANMIASASATVEDLGPWFGALRFRYFGRRPLIEDDSVTSKPTTLFDLRVGYKFPWALDFQTALKYRPDHPGTLFNLGVVRWQGKLDPKGAVQAWEELLRRNPDYPQKQEVLEYIDRAKQHAKG